MPNRLIAHQITKAQHADETSHHLRSLLIPASAENDKFIDNLREAISRKNPAAGRFTSPAGEQPPFQQRVVTYLGDVSDEKFVAFSQDATRLLETEMKARALATGGYVVFAEHEHAGSTYILIVILSTRAQPRFDENLNLVSTVTLDLDHLKHAARIRQSAVAGNEEGVIHFVSARSEGPSDYFNDFLGCEAVTDSVAQGRKLYTVLDQWATQNNLPLNEREDLMQKTYSFWREQREASQPIVLSALANCLNPTDPGPILAHLGNEANNLAGQFNPPPGVMRQFVKFAFSKEGLKIEFDRNAWLNRISVNGTTVTIRQAPADLVESIKAEKHAG